MSKFKNSKVGQFLKDKFPAILETVGDVLPDKGLLGIVKNLVSNDNIQSDAVRLEALKMIQDYELTEMQEVTKRWQSDMNSDSWLSKNVRPLTLIFLLLYVTVLCVLDSSSILKVKDHWVTLFSSLLITTLGAYFGLREVGKFVKNKYK